MRKHIPNLEAVIYYQESEDFRTYVDNYARCHGMDVEEVLTKLIVLEVMKNYKRKGL